MRAILALPVVLALGCAHGQPLPPLEQEELKPRAVTPLVEPQTKVTRQAIAQPAPTLCEAAQVYFSFDSAELTATDKATLDQLAACLARDPRRTVAISGNADERGSDEYNRQLGEERARSVASYLETRGVSQGQVTVFTSGKESPICNRSVERCWQRNRRASLYPSVRM